MNRRAKTASRFVLVASLYVLAAPAFFLVFLVRAVSAFLRHLRVRRGQIRCPHCGEINLVDRLGTCNRCGFREYGSVLYCSNCGQINTWIPCQSCTASIRVL